MKQLLNTLFVTTPGTYLRIEGDTVCVEVEREKRLQVPLHHIGSVVVYGDTMVTPSLIHRCAEDGRSLVFLDRNGRFKARVEGPVSGNVLLRVAQHAAANDRVRSLDVARACVAGKLRNSRYVLLRGARDTRDEGDAQALRHAARLLASHLRKLPLATDVDVVRGLEGDGARVYFGAIPHLVRPDLRTAFSFERRSRRPPLDRFNALLSFLYSMLMNDCRSAVEGVGLDPQIGFLHQVRPGRAALALDLMEEFRPIVADRLALTLINRGQLDETDFDERTGGAVYLNDKGRKTVIVAYQERKQDELTHPLLVEVVPVGLLSHLQARLLARTLRGEVEGYLPFLMR
ncbi:MAG: type I-C CRISPR-associated endonuclease Cas1c [Nitrospirota bacterium]|nr:type I-C CRISPR-associated endonuclease Cas1c [Nitrospirota bacterium]